MKFIFNDGGRAAAGFKGNAGDCVTRAIAIATGKPYTEVYSAMAAINAGFRSKKRKSFGRRSARSGIAVRSKAFKDYMHNLGWKYVPCMGIGTGCKVHLNEEELPSGRLIVQVSRHMTAVIDGVIHDTHNPSDRPIWLYPLATPQDNLPKGVRRLENGNGWAYEPERCVYGYWRIKNPPQLAP